MPQLKFSVSDEAIAYLRWLAKEILFEKGEGDAARHLMMKELERIRRRYRHDEATTGFSVSATPITDSDEPS